MTSPARTVLDLARMLPFREGVVVADSALRTGFRQSDLDAAARSSPCVPGICQARQVLAFADAHAESVLESLARVLFAQHGFPTPQTQVVLGDDAPIGRVDFYWEKHGVVAEVDGLLKYGRPESLVAEKLRQERLENAGFEVVRLTWDDVVRYPQHGVARLRQAFARAARR